jgi:hypothetical protein
VIDEQARNPADTETPTVDLPMLVNRYVDEHREELHRAIVRTDLLFESMSAYVLSATPRGTKFRSQQMQSHLASSWSAKIRPHFFADVGMMPAVHFPGLIFDRQAQATNDESTKLHEFLAMADNERGCVIKRVEGSVTLLEDFITAFKAKMDCKFVLDIAVFASLGYRVTTERNDMVNICMACKQIGKARGGLCCSQYAQSNRRKKHVVFGMRLS